jgi:hypothetical protein
MRFSCHQQLEVVLAYHSMKLEVLVVAAAV